MLFNLSLSVSLYFWLISETIKAAYNLLIDFCFIRWLIKLFFSNDPIAYFELLISGPIRTHNLSVNAIFIRVLV